MITPNEAARILHSQKCHCGASKSAGRPLCSRCFYALPEHMRATLDYRNHSSFDRAYRAAVNYLDVHFQSLKNFKR